MWFTPIVWNLGFISSSKLVNTFKCMPFTYLVEGFRQAFMDNSNIITENNGIFTLVFWIVTIIIFIWGNRVFNKTKKDFADVL